MLLSHPVILPSCRRPCLASKWRPAASAFLMAASRPCLSLLMLASRILATMSVRMSGSGGWEERRDERVVIVVVAAAVAVVAVVAVAVAVAAVTAAAAVVPRLEH